MNQKQFNISHMQCWLFRLAQLNWKLTPAETIVLFKQFTVFYCIAERYDTLHLSSYHHALSDIEAMLAHNGITFPTDRKANLATAFCFLSDGQETVSDETKEACAIETMQCMVRQYATDNNISFEEALFAFAASTTYEVLFDFETAVRKDGPEYIRSLFEKFLARQYT